MSSVRILVASSDWWPSRRATSVINTGLPAAGWIVNSRGWVAARFEVLMIGAEGRRFVGCFFAGGRFVAMASIVWS